MASSGEVEKVRQKVQQMMESYNKSPPDSEALLKLCAADCKVLPPGTPAKVGHAGVKEMIAEMVKSGVTSAETLQADFQQVADDVIIGIGSGKQTYKAQGKSRNMKGVNIWKRIDGEWKLYWDAFNFDD